MGKRLISCSSTNIPTEHSMYRGGVSWYWRKKETSILHGHSSQIIGEGWGKIKSRNDNNKVSLVQNQTLWIQTNHSLQTSIIIGWNWSNWGGNINLSRHSCNSDLGSLEKRRWESMPIFHLECRISLYCTKHCPIIEKVMSYIYKSILVPLIW